MPLQDRITVSTADTIQRLEQSLDRLRRFQYDSQYRALLGDTLMDHLEFWDNKIRSRKNDPFTVVVVGEFKRGKSSFINALLGDIMGAKFTYSAEDDPRYALAQEYARDAMKNQMAESAAQRGVISTEQAKLDSASCKPVMEPHPESKRDAPKSDVIKRGRIIYSPRRSSFSFEKALEVSFQSFLHLWRL